MKILNKFLVFYSVFSQQKCGNDCMTEQEGLTIFFFQFS